MPVNRMRMRPWLCQMIESKTIKGLEWIDDEKNLFSIPWKHAARHGWDMEKDACLFQKWAIHTGKHTNGQAKDPKTWKANFRCALNSLPDIVEVKDRSVNKGHHAMRVFKMLPQASKSREKRAKGKATKTHRRKISSEADEKKDNTDTHSSADECTLEEEVATQENTVGSSTPGSSTPGSSTPGSSTSDSSSDWSPCCSSSFTDAIPFTLQNYQEGDWKIPDSLFHRFQVSPEHDTDYGSQSDIVEICKELEKLEQEQDFRSTSKNCGPVESHFSESSDDGDDMPLYTTLGTDPFFERNWRTFF